MSAAFIGSKTKVNVDKKTENSHANQLFFAFFLAGPFPWVGEGEEEEKEGFDLPVRGVLKDSSESTSTSISSPLNSKTGSALPAMRE